jgi:ribosomal-protein-alanine N-acetyltransferase
MENKSLNIPTINTARLILEPLTEVHSEGMFEMWSQQEVCEYSGSADDFDGNPIRLPAITATDSDKIIDFFYQYQQQSQKVRWAMIRKSDNCFIGSPGFNTLGDCCEIAYHLDPRCWGKGYMGEACEAIANWVFSTLCATSIEAYIDSDNMASIKLVDRLGYRSTGESREGADRYLFTADNC